MSSSSLPSHTLNVKLDHDMVCLSITCHETDGAFCRRACEAGCEDFCGDPDEHVKPVNYCLGVEWISLDNNADECYSGDDVISLHDGMLIDLDWSGDGWQWKPIKEETTA